MTANQRFRLSDQMKKRTKKKQKKKLRERNKYSTLNSIEVFLRPI